MRGIGEGEIYLAKDVCLTELIQSLQCSDNPYCACVESGDRFGRIKSLPKLAVGFQSELIGHL